MPPTADRNIDDIEKTLAPQRAGMYAPIVLPIATPIQMRDFEFIAV